MLVLAVHGVHSMYGTVRTVRIFSNELRIKVCKCVHRISIDVAHIYCIIHMKISFDILSCYIYLHYITYYIIYICQ